MKYKALIAAILAITVTYIEVGAMTADSTDAVDLKTGISAMGMRSLKETVAKLTDSNAKGRYPGSEGSTYCRYYLTDKMFYAGLKKFGSSYADVFFFGEGEREMGINIIGLLPAGKYGAAQADTTKGYIVVGAHYDHLGEAGGKVFPGADNNASGVASMIEIAKGLNALLKNGAELKYNVIFAAFDAKEQGLEGSRNFLRKNNFNGKIAFMLNLDQIGTNLAPPGKIKEYAIILGMESFENGSSAVSREDMEKAVAKANSNDNLGLNIDYTFYGSKNFYEIFERMSDQYAFIESGIPALMITSGIHEHTLKTTDTKEIINYPQLMLRSRLIYYMLCGFLIGEN